MPRSSSSVRILGGVVGGVLGFCIGPVTGSMLGSIMSGPSDAATLAEVGRYSGMAVGLIGGAILGAYLAGHPIVAKWALGLGAAIGGIIPGRLRGPHHPEAGPSSRTAAGNLYHGTARFHRRHNSWARDRNHAPKSGLLDEQCGSDRK